MKNMLKIFGLILGCVLLAGSCFAYEVSGGSREQAKQVVEMVNRYYAASQSEDLRAYGDLFIFSGKAQMGQRLGTAAELWSMYDLINYRVDVKEVSFSPEGGTALVRYVAATTHSNQKGERKKASNEFVALLYRQQGKWKLADVNLADEFFASMDQLSALGNVAGYNVQREKAGREKDIARAGKKPAVKPKDMKEYRDTVHKARFFYPGDMSFEIKGNKMRFKNNAGSAYITYEVMAYEKNGGKYKGSEDMARYLAEHVQHQLKAVLKKPVGEFRAGDLSGHRLDFKWNMKEQPLEQIEIALNGPDRIYSFGLLGSPGAFQQYLGRFETMVASFNLEERPQVKEKKADILIAFPNRGAVTGVLSKEPVSVIFTAEKDAKHIIQCNTMLEAPVILILYNDKGKKVDTNYKKGKLYRGFKENLRKGEKYFFVVMPFKDDNIGKSFTVQVTTE